MTKEEPFEKKELVATRIVATRQFKILMQLHKVFGLIILAAGAQSY